MKQIAYLQLSKYRRLYNDVVRKSLTLAGIIVNEVSTSYGIRLMVAEVDQERAARIVLSVSHTNPKYPK